MTESASRQHPWISALQAELDGLEKALLAGDAPGVEQASARVQTVLQRAPRTQEFGVPGSTLRPDMARCAQRFAQLRQAVLRSAAQNQRALHSLLPQTAAQATYGRPHSGLGGAGRAYLSA